MGLVLRGLEFCREVMSESGEVQRLDVFFVLLARPITTRHHAQLAVSAAISVVGLVMRVLSGSEKVMTLMRAMVLRIHV